MNVLGKLRWFWILCLVVVLLLLASILGNALANIRTVVYTISSARLGGGRLRLALVTDLHSARYGRNQSRLMAQLNAAEPDAVLLCGDIFDSKAPFRHAVTFINAVSEAYPCYFVYGNHEHGTRKLREIEKVVTDAGIPILEGDCVAFSAGGARIRIAGVDDVRDNREGYREELGMAAEAFTRTDDFSVLLSHEPQFIDELLATGADLILSGHTHGGQWSLPGLLNGLYAPGQGLFPKYAGGLYAFGEQTLVVSRGLSKTPLWTPRLFTPRELVILELTGEG